MRVPMMQIGGNRKGASLANKPHALKGSQSSALTMSLVGISINGFAGFEKLIIDWSLPDPRKYTALSCDRSDSALRSIWTTFRCQHMIDYNWDSQNKSIFSSPVTIRWRYDLRLVRANNILHTSFRFSC
ncbi:hypothetical protein TNCV_4732911 [Trichonephila clavipes]|nr:hypothetical protein TNCV_4732911 [Trichonephila clavipes]